MMSNFMRFSLTYFICKGWKLDISTGLILLCLQGRDHQANCQEKQDENNLTYIICLRCGDSGHDMFSCGGDYSPDDLKVFLIC